jgi:hypothetical protein
MKVLLGESGVERLRVAGGFAPQIDGEFAGWH